MGALLPLALAAWLGGWGSAATTYHILDDDGQPFRLRPPQLDLAPPPIPAGLLLVPPLRESEGVPPINGTPIPDAVANTIILVGGAALLTSVVLGILKHH